MRACVALVGSLLASSACGGDDGATDDGGDTSAMFDPTRDTEGETEGPAIVPGDATDLCDAAFSIAEGIHYGTLRARQSDLAGACGQGGPDAFFRLEVTRRSDVWLQARGVGFEPRVGVLPATCSNRWWDRTLACAEGVGTWLTDVAAGSSLVVSIGIDASDPTIESAPVEEGADPLDFRLEVKLRDVLEPGQPCEPASRGRCGAGTACLPEPAGGPAVCTPLSADTCATAEPLTVEIGTTEVAIGRDVVQSDAHAHSCGGSRHPDRVYALSLPIFDEPPLLSVRSDTAQVGLALRGSDCAPDGELSCAPPSDALPSIAASVPASAGRPLLLFVELPLDSTEVDAGIQGEEPPIVLSIELTTPG